MLTSPTLRLLPLLFLAPAALAQPGFPSTPSSPVVVEVAPDRDVRLDGRSIVGRWRAIEVVGDRAATADLARGTLSTVLVVNPTGHTILRGEDRRQGQGAPASFSGRIDGRRLTFRDLPGAAEVSLVGLRLHLVDPRGRRTVFVRAR